MRSASRRRQLRTAVLGILLGAASALAALPISAQENLCFDVTVLHVSPEPGGVDPKAQRFDRIIGRQLRYESLKVMSQTRRCVGLDEIGSVRLPTGKAFRFRPIDAGGNGVLVAVDVDKTAQGDFRLPKGKPLLIGGQPYQGGNVVTILEYR